MKQFLSSVFGFAFALMVFSMIGGDVSAQLIDPTRDSLTQINSATSNAYSFRTLLKRIVDFFLLFLGIIAVIMVIYGGFLYVTSAGNDQNVEKGKNILIYAAIGIIVILISFALVNTLLGAGKEGAEAAAYIPMIQYT